jgi:hypothetical protein
MKAPLVKTPSIATNFGRLEHSFSNQQGPNSMKVGQRVDALVLSQDHHGQVKLRIGNTVLTASSDISLPKNSHLLLQVIQLHPQVLLQLIPATGEKAALKALQDAVTNLLPRQDGLAPSLAALLHKTFIYGKSREQQSLRMLFHSLARAIPERASISHGEGLRQAIMHSGLFLEAILSRSRKHKKTDTSKDLKACLLRLQHGLEQHKCQGNPAADQRSSPVPLLSNSIIPPTKKGLPIPQHNLPIGFTPDNGDIEEHMPDIMSRTRSALSRLGLLQIYSAENFNQGEYMWQLELPVRYRDVVEIVSISIEKDDQRGTDGKHTSWIVNLAVDLPVLGAVQIRVSVFNQGVSSCFQPASSATAEVINMQFERLRTGLQRRGVTVLNLSCQEKRMHIFPSDHTNSIMDIIA